MYNDQLVAQIANMNDDNTILTFDPIPQFAHVLTFEDFPKDVDYTSYADL